MGGLPGSGKSSLSRELADRAGFTVIRSDVVRKDLAGLVEEQPSPADYRGGIYTPAWDERTYAECSRRAEARLLEGRSESWSTRASVARRDRRRLRELADTWGFPWSFFAAGPTRR